MMLSPRIEVKGLQNLSSLFVMQNLSSLFVRQYKKKGVDIVLELL